LSEEERVQKAVNFPKPLNFNVTAANLAEFKERGGI
jgi:hypothetical protein